MLMNNVNYAWIRGEEELGKIVSILLKNGYELNISIDRESENLFGEPSFLVTYVENQYSGYRFVAVDEMGDPLKKETEEE